MFINLILQLGPSGNIITLKILSFPPSFAEFFNLERLISSALGPDFKEPRNEFEVFVCVSLVEGFDIAHLSWVLVFGLCGIFFVLILNLFECKLFCGENCVEMHLQALAVG